MIRVNFEQLVVGYINNDIDAKRALNTLIFKNKSPVLSADEISYLTNMLSNEIENAATLTLKGSLYHSGQGYSLNYPEAIRLYEQAIALGDATAMNNRAYMHQQGQGEADGTPAVLRKYYEERAACGSTTAVDDLAYMLQQRQAYMLHEGHRKMIGEPDYPAAVHLYQGAMALGNTTAMNNRALMHKRGHGEVDGKPNYPAAICLFEQAIALGDSTAMIYRARMHQYGQGEICGKPNYLAAIRIFEQLIALDDARTMTARAHLHQQGQGEADGKPNYPAAICLLDRTIALGYRTAKTIGQRAEMYENGQGEIDNKPNLIKAAELFRQAGSRYFQRKLNRLHSKNDDLHIKYHYLCSQQDHFKDASLFLFLKKNPLTQHYLIEDTLISEEDKEIILVALKSMDEQDRDTSTPSSSTLRRRFFKPAIEEPCELSSHKTGGKLKFD